MVFFLVFLFFTNNNFCEMREQKTSLSIQMHPNTGSQKESHKIHSTFKVFFVQKKRCQKKDVKKKRMYFFSYLFANKKRVNQK